MNGTPRRAGLDLHRDFILHLTAGAWLALAFTVGMVAVQRGWLPW